MTDDAALVAELRRQMDGLPLGSEWRKLKGTDVPRVQDLQRALLVSLHGLLDLAEEAIRLRGVRDAAMAAAKDLTGGELFIDDKNGIGLIAACAALAPDDAQLRAALDAAKEKP